MQTITNGEKRNKAVLRGKNKPFIAAAYFVPQKLSLPFFKTIEKRLNFCYNVICIIV
jgi:hypothetical protein